MSKSDHHDEEKSPMDYGDAIVSDQATTALEAQERAQLDVQIATAKKYPRSVAKFQENAHALATINEDVAASCFYELPRAGKTISGPSVRLAEIVMSEWGNAHAGARVVEVGEKTLTAQAVFRDLEKNTAVSMEVTRRITNSRGKRFSEDMIAVTSNAACKIAYRNAVFSGVPRSFWMEVYEAARTASIGDASNLDEAKAKILQYFAPMGKREKDILGLLGRDSMDEVTKDDLIFMRGVATAIRERETSLEEAFHPVEEDDAPRTTVTPDDIGSSKKKKADEPKPEPEPEQDPEPEPEPKNEADSEDDEDDGGEPEPGPDPQKTAPPSQEEKEPSPPSESEKKDPPSSQEQKSVRAATSDQVLEINELAWKVGMQPSKLKKWTVDNFGVSPERLNRNQASSAISKLRLLAEDESGN